MRVERGYRNFRRGGAEIRSCISFRTHMAVTLILSVLVASCALSVLPASASDTQLQEQFKLPSEVSIHFPASEKNAKTSNLEIRAIKTPGTSIPMAVGEVDLSRTVSVVFELTVPK
jgi:hypothetical protein